MAIEPLGSIMTAQAQPVVQNTQKTERVNTEVARPNNQPEENTVDPSTVTVANVGETQETGNATSFENGNSAETEEQIKQQNEKIKKAVEQLNKNIANSEAVFGIHEGTNRVTIKLVDKDSKKVIKELPPEKTLDMIAKVWEMAGLMVDERR